MEQQTQEHFVCKEHTTTYVALFIVAFVVGVGVGIVAVPHLPPSLGGVAGQYQAGFDAAKKRVEESNLGGILRTPEDVRSLTGFVMAINGNRLSLHTQSMGPFDDPALDDRIVVVNGDTKITTLLPKDIKVFQAELANFSKNQQLGKNTAQPPEPFTQALASVSSIMVGDPLIITTLENIRTKNEFTASEIQIQKNVVAPVPPKTLLNK